MSTALTHSPTSPGPPRAGAHPASRVVTAVVAVTVVSLAGSVLAVVTGLSVSWWDAVGPTGRLSVPLPMNAALLVLAIASGSTRRRVSVPAAAALALACGVAVVSGAFDGGYAAQLAPVERAAQATLVLGLVAAAVLAGRRARSAYRS